MKIGIMTIFRTGNYGGMLQAFALREAIRENGFGEADIINYCADALKGKIDFKFLKKAGLFRTGVAVVEKLYYHPRQKKARAFSDSFATERELKKEELAALNDAYDIFLSGSDQIWNPQLQQGDYAYLLDFVTDKKKKRSYASSFGVKTLPPEYVEDYRRLLSDYHTLTVRETAGAALVKDLIGKEVPTVLDPTLLLTPDQWEAVLAEKKAEKNSIFVYQMAHSALLAKAAAKARKALGGGVIFLPFPIGGMCRCKPVLNYSPAEWLRAIHDAPVVLTDSFHGTVFSILFSRPFYYVITSETVRARISRVETLLSTLGLSDRIVDNIEDMDFSKPIDYKAVHEKLATERETSLAILKELCHDDSEG